ncbi:MAG: glycoside hydrolase family 15 protein [Thiohalorhabdus sp.]|uniref:glycoside hydrolase family 15 protein n=1 Tax=Thiohalorhabdus sp. TaxID=3094134 RepID=UPI003980A007
MPYKKIGDHGIIGNGATIALVGLDGAVDWMCSPTMDSPSVFGAILDDRKGGRFAVTPEASWDSAQHYFRETNVLQTLFRTAEGEAEVVDFMPAGEEARRLAGGRDHLIRRITALSGEMALAVECSPRPDYAREHPEREYLDERRWRIPDGEAFHVFSATVPLDWEGDRARIRLRAGERVFLCFSRGGEGLAQSGVENLQAVLEATHRYWLDWSHTEEVTRYPAERFWRESLDRAALVLKLLQFEDTGAIAAGATTSLPTILYGERNWDYRFSWIRDTAMTLAALFELGHSEEVTRYLDWLKELCAHEPPGRLQIIYQLTKAEPPGGETRLEHLEGYKGSYPAHIGQYNVGQHQHDIYGELLETIFAVSRYVGKIDMEHWEYLRPMVDTVCGIWRDADSGIWEMRTGPHHYVHSKLMCWVALDRGIKVAEHYGLPGDLERWRAERAAVRADILERGYRDDLGSFTQHYDTDAVDASLLMIPIVGFLPADDPRVAGTIARIEEELLVDGTMLRYRMDDGLPGQEHGFMICLFWYVDCLILQGRLNEAGAHLRRIDRFSNHLGLFGEQYDPRYKEITGNIPQAYSHIGFAVTAIRYLNARRTQNPRPHRLGWGSRLGLLARPRLLNPEAPVGQLRENPAEELKRAVNTVRGHFYDGHRQRVDYHLVRGSGYYRRFREVAADLAAFDPGSLATDAERMAFWINVYNAIVIHGVIELGIRDTIREVPWFFRGVRYRVGEHTFTPNEIEHGILRGNRRAPWRLRRAFGPGDPRRELAVREPDFRVHFALVCGSRSCPPVEVFEADGLEEQLETAAKIFLNATTRVRPERETVGVSRLFWWYRNDFPAEDAELVRYIARRLFDRELGTWMEKRADSMQLRYLPYDWRLNES